MTLRRNIAPSFNKIKELNFPAFEKIAVKSNISIYSIKAGIEPVIRLDFIFNAGLAQQIKNAQASFTASMLNEGTSTKNAQELADALDYYGAYFQARNNSDDAAASLFCLEKHLIKCLPLFLEAITDSIFPIKELEILKKNSIQRQLVNEKKNSYLCKKSFYKNILGINHPYATFSEKADFENISIEDLKTFYETNYLNGLKYVMLSGNFSINTLNLIIKQIELSPLNNTYTSNSIPTLQTNFGNHFIERNDSVQTAIRIGKISINKNHKDYRKLQLLNLIFGGYFGSRLMKNIREDKGLTYGIYSVLEPLKLSSIWYIDTEMNSKNRERGLIEIYRELNILKSELIDLNELEVAKNYLLGSFLRSLDGAFSLADRLKNIIDNNLSLNYYSEFVKIINETNQEDLLLISNNYLSEDHIVEVLVGKK